MFSDGGVRRSPARPRLRIQPYRIGVNQEIQLYLAELLADARATKGRPRDEMTMAGFSGALAALRYIGELSADEESDWQERMRIALDVTRNRVVLRVAREGEPLPATPAPLHIRPFPRFVRSIPGPDTEYELYGGRLRIIAIEVYDTMATVRWHVAPQPDISTAFPYEATQLAHDVEGIDSRAAEELKRKAEKRLRISRLHNFGLVDDVGTEYRPSGGGSRGGSYGTTGEADFAPAPPAFASKLTITWLDLTVDVPLS
jgi:hypothetical protein